MQEDLKQNYILLSQIAKEKKYAQEYLGLLARRGDIGSIRIGKRWYTTWEWFTEFLENSQKKKAEIISEAAEAKPAFVPLVETSAGKSEESTISITLPETEVVKVDPEKIAEEKIIPKFDERHNIKINLPLAAPVRETANVARPIAVERKPESRIKISVAPRIERREDDFQKVSFRKMGVSRAPAAPAYRPAAPRLSSMNVEKKNTPVARREISTAERNKNAIPYHEFKVKRNDNVFSPDFSTEEKTGAVLFPRFALGFSFVLAILLIGASGYFIWSGGLLSRGVVAGASDEKLGDFSGIKSGGDHYLLSAGDKIKESLSISQVIAETVRTKSEEENSKAKRR